MTYHSFCKTLKIIDQLREKVLNQANHPLEKFYFDQVKKIGDMPPEKMRRYYMRYALLSGPEINPKAA